MTHFYPKDDPSGEIWDDPEEDEPKETCLLCGCIIGEEVGVGLRNPDGSGRCWCDNCYEPEAAPPAPGTGER